MKMKLERGFELAFGRMKDIEKREAAVCEA